MRARSLLAGVAVAAGVAALAVVPVIHSASSAESEVLFALAPARAAQPVVHRFQGYQGRCITVPGDGPIADGTALVMSACSASTRQVFTGTDAGEARIGDGMCLDAAGGVIADGTVVQVARCNGGPAQKWYVTGENGADTMLFTQTGGTCVDVAGWNTAEGAPLILWTCGDRQANQTWQLIPPS